MVLRYTCIAIVLGALALPGCLRQGTTGLPPGGGDDDDDVTAPLYPPDFGDGHDGAVDLNDQDLTPNDCAPVVSASKNDVQLGAPLAANVGDRLLLLQVQDDTGVPVDDPAGATDLGNAGRWEIVDVLALGVGDALSTSDLLHIYYSAAPASAAQACVVPQYESIRLRDESELRAADWDGATGGVVAFFVDGPLRMDTVNEEVTARSRGFRGGPLGQNDGTPDIVDDFTPSDRGGGKGEGVDGRYFNAGICQSPSPDTCFGRGGVLLGGGGGNGLNAGGGGGSHVGAGGLGGTQSNSGGTPQNAGTNGRPGFALTLTGPHRLLLGGAGGAGHQNESAANPGENGGGIVIIIARTLRGAGRIRAGGGNGPTDPGNAGNDGGGGGGAGGTVLVWTEDISQYAGEARSLGGFGGVTAGGDRNGPGGGGGGGRILYNAALAGTVMDVSGGVNGESMAGGAEAWGATPGAPGATEEIAGLPFELPPP